MLRFLTRFARDESGATAIEYGLIAALVAVTLVTAISALRDQLGVTFTTIANAIP
ncbi:MAG TPA: Flp family type IVb pilin [Phenylobacterium sp.]|jgi:pilus assembly protein Flp/PilA